MIDIKKAAPGVQIEMRYATDDNFTGKKLYPISECLLCEPAAERLARVQTNLEKRGLGLKVWDCYRPLSIQKKLWSIVPDPRYVADPKTGSRHNRGASVDLTLVDKRGVELAMPTAFDEFSEKAHRDYENLPDPVKANRRLLQTEMEKEGFIGLPTEWWHFDAPEWASYALRDEPLGSSSLRKDLPNNFLSSLSSSSQQLIVVIADNWESARGRLQRYEKEKSAWKKVGRGWGVSIGSKGLSINKREGDLTAPAGFFKMGKAYGYDGNPPAGSRWPYQPVTEGWVCVDDPNSHFYNQVLLSSKMPNKDWVSCEIMRRSDALYKWVISIEFNPSGEKGRGSCIFLHVWRRPYSPTEGCTAMDEKNMITLLKWLDPSKEPFILQLPKETFESLESFGDSFNGLLR